MSLLGTVNLHGNVQLDGNDGIKLKINDMGQHKRVETIKAYVETLAILQKDFDLPVKDEVSKLFDIIKGDVNYMVDTKLKTNFVE